MTRHSRTACSIRPVCCVVLAVLFGQSACGPRAQDQPIPPAPANGVVASIPLAMPDGFVAAADAPRDPKTGLPTRAVHSASGVAFVLVPAGELVMGDREAGGGRKRAIRDPFYLGETEVTVRQFRLFSELTDYRTDAERGVREGDHKVGGFSELLKGEGQYREWLAAANWRNPLPNFAGVLGDERLSDAWPVVQVSWHDAKRFAAHYGFRLPSEAQWEYACRADSGSPYPWGEADAGAGHANVADASFRRHMGLPDGGFPFDDRATTLAKVASYRPNAWGLYDMIGNVEEWCEDEYRSRIPEDLVDESAVVADGPGPHHHVIRGGSWIGGGGGSGDRHVILSEGRREWIGFRVAAATRRVAGAAGH